MSRIYAKPPIIEAVCELRFKTAKEWNPALPGLLFSKIEQEFPEITEEAEFEVQFISQESNGVVTPKGRVKPKIQYRNPQSAQLVQIMPGLISVHHLAPYTSWAVYKTVIMSILSIYQEVARPAEVARIGLRYINQICIPKQGKLADYFTYLPSFPPEVAREPSEVVVRAELPIEDPKGRLVMALGQLQIDLKEVHQYRECKPYILDLDFITPEQFSLSFDGIESWIEQAHRQIEVAFEASITGESRQLFLEKP
jgi:uncharacterized protein (TIGR04255 family)